jgi:hypothetical protein
MLSGQSMLLWIDSEQGFEEEVTQHATKRKSSKHLLMAQRSAQGQPQMPLFLVAHLVQFTHLLSTVQYCPMLQWASHWHSSAVLRHLAGQLPPSNASPHCQQPSHSKQLLNESQYWLLAHEVWLLQLAAKGAPRNAMRILMIRKWTFSGDAYLWPRLSEREQVLCREPGRAR